jgi:Domain of unknown function (DUF4956)
MHRLVLFAIDLVAVTLLVFGLYFPRHRRRDLVAAFLGVNVGVLAVAGSLSSSTVGAGLGLGLFGVLSIIRLRSTELDQSEVAYYFSALALGIMGPLTDGAQFWLCPVLMGLILLVMYVGDHPRLLRRYRRQVLVLDTAVTDETALVAQCERLLGARVHRVAVERTDLVNETTVVEVRYSYSSSRAAARESEFAGAAR